MTTNNVMIYIHIPFCDSKCIYCNFVSGCFNNEIKIKYFKKLSEEICFKKQLFNNKIVTSIYIGGGTPSCVNPEVISNLINLIKTNYNVEKNAEITIEANPCSTDEFKLQIYKNAGINRISFGVQSLCNSSLKLLGRRHNKKQAFSAIKLANKVGFSNINADLIIGIPKSNFIKLKHSAKVLIKHGIKHLSAYMLINEEGTVLNKLVKQHKLFLKSEDNLVKEYQKLYKYLQKKGFNRYETSSFSKPGYECNHNIGYWTMRSYVGFGVSAHSFYNDNRIENTCNITEYINGNFEFKVEPLSNASLIEETLFLGLRTAKGVNIPDLFNLGYNILKDKEKELTMLKNNNCIFINNGYLSIAPQFFGVADSIVLKLLPNL